MIQPVWADSFALDPNYSTIVYKIKHLMGHSVGTFPEFNGTITLDKDNQKIEQIDVTINIESVNSRNAKRDEDLRSERFFDTKNFPQGVFHSTKITKKEIIGDLTLKGVTKSVKLDYNWAGVGKDQYGNNKMALSASCVVDRSEFGISHNEKTKDNKWLLGNDVELMIDVQGKEE
jgi:polyisoprenoid-binding protein YceI